MPAFNALRVASGGQEFRIERVFRAHFQQVSPRLKLAHYEWVARKRSKALDVALHFEWEDAATSERALAPFLAERDRIGAGVPETLMMGRFGDSETSRGTWREIRFRISTDAPASPANAARAAELMKILIERTYPLLPRAVERLP